MLHNKGIANNFHLSLTVEKKYVVLSVSFFIQREKIKLSGSSKVSIIPGALAGSVHQRFRQTSVVFVALSVLSG